MHDLLWFLAGAALASVVVLWIARRTGGSRAMPLRRARALRGSEAVAESPLFHSLARELADIASGVEGSAFLLVETAQLSPARVPAIDRLWHAVLRLRRFHDKIRALVEVPTITVEPLALQPLLAELCEELKTSELGLRLSTAVPDDLPRLATNRDSLLCALSFVCHALRELEPGARCLSVYVEHDFEHEPPQLELELHLEYDEDPGRTPGKTAPEAGFHVARTAAENLLRGLGTTVEFERDPGQVARALVCLPIDARGLDADADGDAEFGAGAVAPRAGAAAAAAAPVAPAASVAPALAPEPRPARQHHYGGVLVLEHDPAVRSMVASELKASGRAVFACPDGAAARSLLQATPDRFEMLIVDQAARLGPADALAATASRLCPELKIFVLSDCHERELPPEIAPRVRCLRKPFGMHELRRALTAALTDACTDARNAREARAE